MYLVSLSFNVQMVRLFLLHFYKPIGDLNTDVKLCRRDLSLCINTNIKSSTNRNVSIGVRKVDISQPQTLCCIFNDLGKSCWCYYEYVTHRTKYFSVQSCFGFT